MTPTDSGRIQQAARLYRVLAPTLMLFSAGVLLHALSSRVWLVLLVDGAYVAAVLAGAIGAGAWPANWLFASAHRQLPTARQLRPGEACVALALGLGIVGTATLVLGVAGLLTRISGWGVIATGVMAGLARLAARPEEKNQSRHEPELLSEGRSVPQLTGIGAVLRAAALTPLAVPLAVMLYGASLPPGLLWDAEGNGYDALEYHLQVQREYFEAGRITHLPHNVYASFPQQVEVFYLLLMHLMGGPHAGALAAQLFHATLGIAAIAAIAAFSPPGWPRVVAALVAGSTPWLAYVGCLAYVENGVLFFGAVAAGVLIGWAAESLTVRTAEFSKTPIRSTGPMDVRTVFAAGICAGLAAGCKYTALVLVAASLGISLLFVVRGTIVCRARSAVIFAAGALLAFAPWMIRNIAFVGNPVFPLAYNVFGGADWTAAEAQRWERGHALKAEERGVVAGARLAWRELVGGPMFGFGIFMMAALGAILRRDRVVAIMLTWFALILAVWATATHVPGRFAILVIVPLAIMAGRAVRSNAERGLPNSASRGVHSTKQEKRGWCDVIHVGSRATLVAVVFGAVGVAGWNGIEMKRLLDDQAMQWQTRTNVPLARMVDHVEILIQTNAINMRTPEKSQLWIVGDAAVFYVDRPMRYHVVFSRDPWLDFAGKATPAEAVAWLRTQGITHVVFSWSEIRRLNRTYGFAAIVTPDWVQALCEAGLRPIGGSSDAPPGSGVVEVYEVPGGSDDRP